MTSFRPLSLSILLKDLKKRGHQVFVFTQDREGEKEEFLKGCEGQMVSLDEIEETPCPTQPF